MRPPKTIVIIDPHEDRQGITRFTLWTRMFDAIGVPSIYAAHEVAAIVEVDLLIAYWPVDELRFAELGRDIQTPTLFIASKNATGRNFADATLELTMSTAVLIERIKIMTAGKRGPKQGSHHIPKEVVSCPSQNLSAKSAVA